MARPLLSFLVIMFSCFTSTYGTFMLEKTNLSVDLTPSEKN